MQEQKKMEEPKRQRKDREDEEEEEDVCFVKPSRKETTKRMKG